MRCECPSFKRCCFCIPLRYGILVWGYIKLIISALLSGLFISAIVHSYAVPVFVSIMVAVLMVDIGFHIAFIIGGHKKNYKIIRVYYYYGWVSIGLLVGFICFQIGYIIHTFYDTPEMMARVLLYATLRELTVQFFNVGLTLYLVLMVRSEMIKLHDNQKFRFENIAGEAECTLQIGLFDQIPAVNKQEQKTEIINNNEQGTEKSDLIYNVNI